MKAPISTMNDAEGKVQAVVVPVEEWNEMVEKMRHYEQVLKIRSSLGKAMDQVARMRSGKLKKRTLKDVLREA
jgi:PHD/YefM family antitoxin component YafN of YafNO toxin-antitoxin module